MPDEQPLTPVSQTDLEQALAHALQFDGRRQFKLSGESMAKITAAHLVACLQQAGFVVMKAPLAPAHTYSPGRDRRGG